MRARAELTRLSAVLVTALLLCAPAVAEDIATSEFGDFSIVHRAALPTTGVAEIAARTERALRRVSAWLAQSGAYAGRPYDSPIRVLIDPDKGTPSQMRSTIFVPEARVLAAAAAGRLAEGDFGLVHEVTHVLAASAYRKDRNRFYDDGLAVFLQQKFGPAGNYPADGLDLHLATAKLASSCGSLIPLAEADQARRESGDRRRLGYLQLGSFTQFLIENHGIDAYMRIFHGEKVEVVTGKTFAELEQRWQALIQSF